MKILPRTMFAVQVWGSILSAVVCSRTTWLLLESIPNSCNSGLLPPGSPWTCPIDSVHYTVSVIWGFIGPARIFGPQGIYNNLTWFYLVGIFALVPVYVATKVFLKATWLKWVNMPIVLIGASPSRISCEQHHVAFCWDVLQWLHFPLPQNLVETLQLPSVGGSRCRNRLHGCAIVAGLWSRSECAWVVGKSRWSLPTSALSHCCWHLRKRVPCFLKNSNFKIPTAEYLQWTATANSQNCILSWSKYSLYGCSLHKKIWLRRKYIWKGCTSCIVTLVNLLSSFWMQHIDRGWHEYSH